MGKFHFGVFLFFLISSCTSAEKVKVEEKIVNHNTDRDLNLSLTKSLVKSYGQWKDDRVQKHLVNQIKKIDKSPFELVLLNTSKIIVQPGFERTLYISKGVFESIEYENEMLFLVFRSVVLSRSNAVAEQYKLIKSQEVSESLLKLPTQSEKKNVEPLAGNWFEAGGLFDYPSQTFLKACEDTIDLLKKGNIDIRGSISLVKRIDTNKKLKENYPSYNVEPNIEETLMTLSTKTSTSTPLKDSLIKSVEYTAIRNSVRTKKAKK
jgi:hypothetical protein